MLRNEVINAQGAGFHLNSPGRHRGADGMSSALFPVRTRTAVLSAVHLPVVFEAVDEPLFE